MYWGAQAGLLLVIAATVYAITLDVRFDDQRRRAIMAAGVVLFFPLALAYWIRRLSKMREP